MTVLDTSTQVTASVNYFWSNLVKFASFLTFLFAGIIAFIFIYDFDSDNDFELRKRTEMQFLRYYRHGDDSSEGGNQNEIEYIPQNFSENSLEENSESQGSYREYLKVIKKSTGNKSLKKLK